MADLDQVRLINMRKGNRAIVNRLIVRLDAIFQDDQLEPAHKIHELESKLKELKARFDGIEELDQQILAFTDADDLEAEMEACDDANTSIQDAVASRASTRPKIALPRFNGDILQWQPFWQAFCAEIESDDTLASINKFNYLVGQLDQNVLNTVAGLIPSNENYVVLVDLLKERYGRKPKVIAAYMRALYNIQKPEANLNSLRSFYVEAYVRGLDSLGKSPDSYGDLLVCILLDKLPGDVRKSVARQHDQDEFTLDQLRFALKGEIRVMEAGQVSMTAMGMPSSKQFYPRHSTTMFNEVKSAKLPFKYPCVYCEADHSSTQCNVVTTFEERSKIVQQKRLCFNCLSSKHQRKDCGSKAICKVCKKQHHSSLHDSSRSSNPPSNQQNTVINAHIQVKVPVVGQESALMAHNSATNLDTAAMYPFVFLKTAVVEAVSSNLLELNCMFDESAQCSWMTRSFPESYEVVEFGILAVDGASVSLRAVVIDHLVNPLDDRYRKQVQDLLYLKNLNLAHPYSGEDVFPIDLLIGADIYWNFIGDERPVRGEGPTAIGSKVGYLVSGPMESVRVSKPIQFVNLHIQSADSLNDLSLLWSLETLGIFPQQEKISEAADYIKKCIKFSDGHYTARFPWKSDHPELATNFNMVKNMTRATIKRLARDGMLGVFATIIQEQLDHKFIEQVPQEQLSKGCHYIPYHYVRKESSTTPIRIVYNCSNKGRNGVSFNDCVEAGATLHNDQIHLLTRFRVHAIGIVADVEKAHHISLQDSDRDYLRWMWLSNTQDPGSPLAIYRFKVVPFVRNLHHLFLTQSSCTIFQKMDPQ